MPEYSVTITLRGRDRLDIKKQLRTAFSASVAEQSKIAGLDELLNYYESCQANDHFGCVHWTDEDLVTKLEELHVQATPGMLDSIKSSYDLRHIADRMIETGWKAIEQAIVDADAA